MISVALIGCGNIAVGYDARPDKKNTSFTDGARTHLKAIQQAGGFEVVLCIDPDPLALSRVTEIAQNCRPYSSTEEFNAAPINFDIAVISSPTEFHEEHFTLAVRRGAKAIFCEKPICPDPDIAGQMLELAKSKDIKVAINYLRLWDTKLIELAENIENGTFGELQSGTGYFSKGLSHNGPHMIVLLADLLGELTPCEKATQTISQKLPREFAALSHKNALIVLNGLDNTHYDAFELELCFAKAIIRLEDGARRISIRYPCNHPEYPKLIYPEKLVSYHSCQQFALPQAWLEWKRFFENGAEMRRDAQWCARQEAIAMTLAGWQNRH